MTSAAYARSHGVSRQTVLRWRQRGYLVLAYNGLIDVDASDALLAQRPDIYRGGVARGFYAGGKVSA